MKRRQFLQAASGGLVASAVAAPAIAQSSPEVKWRLTASWPKSLDTLYGGCEYFSKRIAEITDNKFQIQSLPPAKSSPGCKCSTPSATAPSRWATPRCITTSARMPPSLSAPRCRSDSTPGK